MKLNVTPQHSRSNKINNRSINKIQQNSTFKGKLTFDFGLEERVDENEEKKFRISSLNNHLINEIFNLADNNSSASKMLYKIANDPKATLKIKINTEDENATWRNNPFSAEFATLNSAGTAKGNLQTVSDKFLNATKKKTLEEIEMLQKEAGNGSSGFLSRLFNRGEN